MTTDPYPKRGTSQYTAMQNARQSREDYLAQSKQGDPRSGIVGASAIYENRQVGSPSPRPPEAREVFQGTNPRGQRDMEANLGLSPLTARQLSKGASGILTGYPAGPPAKPDTERAKIEQRSPRIGARPHERGQEGEWGTHGRPTKMDALAQYHGISTPGGLAGDTRAGAKGQFSGDMGGSAKFDRAEAIHGATESMMKEGSVGGRKPKTKLDWSDHKGGKSGPVRAYYDESIKIRPEVQ